MRRILFLVVLIAVAALAGRAAWLGLSRGDLLAGVGTDGLVARAVGWLGMGAGHGPPPGFASSNGRTEATEVIVATKLPGRIAEVRVREGDEVKAGELLAQMDTRELEAALAQARAEQRRAEEHLRYVDALLAQAHSELEFAEKSYERANRLQATRSVSEDRVDETRNRLQVATSGLQATRVQRVEAEAAIAAARAKADQVSVQIEDSALLAPRGGRIQFRLAEPGEVLAAGGRVLTLIDLEDAYMTFFLPEQQAGQVAIGAEARIVLDAFPDRPVAARISFVSSEAQFTPKTVETAHERQKLSFRVKAQIDVPEKYRAWAKPGLPGVSYVRLDPQAQWPAWLAAWEPK
ncbi:MAG: efflux RND transporter periplasmic adaptor subunit [Gammaproteobacteria bacterium]|jgi:HlyD family secretion protein|nr:efflux RND transporter periplasmic adaptor subunit [Gammaproteobacteria bacterium]